MKVSKLVRTFSGPRHIILGCNITDIFVVPVVAHGFYFNKKDLQNYTNR